MYFYGPGLIVLHHIVWLLMLTLFIVVFVYCRLCLVLSFFYCCLCFCCLFLLLSLFTVVFVFCCLFFTVVFVNCWLCCCLVDNVEWLFYLCYFLMLLSLLLMFLVDLFCYKTTNVPFYHRASLNGSSESFISSCCLWNCNLFANICLSSCVYIFNNKRSYFKCNMIKYKYIF